MSPEIVPGTDAAIYTQFGGKDTSGCNSGPWKARGISSSSKEDQPEEEDTPPWECKLKPARRNGD